MIGVKNGFAVLGAILLLAACNEHAPVRENAATQYRVFSQAKWAELGPAEGTFTGTVKMISSNKVYAVELVIHRDIVMGAAPDQPTVTIEDPRLAGTFSVPILVERFLPAKKRGKTDKAPNGTETWDIPFLSPDVDPISDFDDILGPMGRGPRVRIEYGNYMKNTRTLKLPYSVASGDTRFGIIEGVLEGDHFRGRWTTKLHGAVVEEFDLVRSKK